MSLRRMPPFIGAARRTQSETGTGAIEYGKGFQMGQDSDPGVKSDEKRLFACLLKERPFFDLDAIPSNRG